jgi:hypothetical protein
VAKKKAAAAATPIPRYRVECFPSIDKQYYFVVRNTGNHEARLTSEMYTRKTTMRKYAKEFSEALNAELVDNT